VALQNQAVESANNPKNNNNTSLFAVSELGGRCAAWLIRSSSDLCSEW